MRKILIVGTGLLVFLLAACSGGGDTKEEGANGPPAAATEVVDQPTPVTEEPTAESESGGGLFEGALNPFNLLSLGSEGGSDGLPAVAGEADPSLKAALVTLEDLPPGYSELMPGGMSFSFETDEGSMSMAASMFSLGEAIDEFPESMVMSGVVLASGDIMEQSLGELERYSDPAELEREIENALGAGQAMPGIGVKDLRVLDASGLGDGGIGLHMVMTMDLEALAEGFGAEMDQDMPPEAEIFKEGIAFDMYVFARGNHLLMMMSMWPGAGSAPLDIRALAEVMDTRAEDAF